MERQIKQVILETRHVIADISDGGDFDIEMPVFAWALYDDDLLEPLFIDSRYQINEYPYGAETIKRVSGRDVGVVSYKWQ